jgi:hypothetical protein
MVEAAGVEISQDVKQTERLLHDQELGVLGDPTASLVIWWSRAERGQSVRPGILPAVLPGAAHRGDAMCTYRVRSARAWPTSVPTVITTFGIVCA